LFSERIALNGFTKSRPSWRFPSSDGVSAKFLVRDLLESMEGHWLEALPPRNALEDLFGRADAASPKLQDGPPEHSM
jgi:hypothetical protein